MKLDIAEKRCPFFITGEEGRSCRNRGRTPLKKYTNYKISFLAKGITDVQMFADLFAEGYDQDAQQLDISVAQSDDFERYSFTLNSGDCPSRVMLRIGIQGLGAVEVMDVSLRELVPNETAAYEKVFEDEE